MTKNTVPRASRSRKNRGEPAAVKRPTSSPSTPLSPIRFRSKSSHLQRRRVLGLPVRQIPEVTHFNNHYDMATKKKQQYKDTDSPSKVLIVELDSKDSNVLGFEKRPQKRKGGKQDVIQQALLDDEFEEIEKELEKFEDPKDVEYHRTKLRHFALVFKTGLLAYPHFRTVRTTTSIPVAATSHFQKGISYWKRLRRCCLACASEKTKAEMMDSLLHKDSLEKFMDETEQLEEAATEHLVITNNLGHRKLQAILQEDEAFKRRAKLKKGEGHEGEEEEGEDEDLRVEFVANIKPPVKIYPPPVTPLRMSYSHYHEFHTQRVISKIKHKIKDKIRHKEAWEEDRNPNENTKHKSALPHSKLSQIKIGARHQIEQMEEKRHEREMQKQEQKAKEKAKQEEKEKHDKEHHLRRLYDDDDDKHHSEKTDDDDPHHHEKPHSKFSAMKHGVMQKLHLEAVPKKEDAKANAQAQTGPGPDHRQRGDKESLKHPSKTQIQQQKKKSEPFKIQKKSMWHLGKTKSRHKN